MVSIYAIDEKFDKIAFNSEKAEPFIVAFAKMWIAFSSDENVRKLLLPSALRIYNYLMRQHKQKSDLYAN